MPRLTAVVALFALMAVPAAAQEPPSPGDAAAWSLQELREARAAKGRPWHGFVRVPPLSAGLYVLEAGATDAQQPHERDELYYVVSGRAVLVAGDERFDAAPGSVLYVKAEVPHRFVEIEEDLEVLVFFGGAEPAS